LEQGVQGNNAGIVTPLGRKREIYGICQEYGITIVEDDAYYYLQYPSLQGSPSHLLLCLTGHNAS